VVEAENDDYSCAFCKAKIEIDSLIVPGCKRNHATHLRCYALIEKRIPGLECAGSVHSACAPQSIRIEPTETQDENRKAVCKHLVSMIDVEVNRDISKYKPAQCGRHFKAIERSKLALDVMQNESNWTEPIECINLCRTHFKNEPTRKCAMCNELIRNAGSDAISTCSAHHVHLSCWAMFKRVQLKEPSLKVCTECPAMLFRFSTCSHFITNN
jgi:hypothetical protein